MLSRGFMTWMIWGSRSLMTYETSINMLCQITREYAWRMTEQLASASPSAWHRESYIFSNLRHWIEVAPPNLRWHQPSCPVTSLVTVARLVRVIRIFRDLRCMLFSILWSFIPLFWCLAQLIQNRLF